MSDQSPAALSFAGVADAYDRARPSYPREAIDWLVGSTGATVVEIGAGTGKCTDVLIDAGHDVLATDPLDEMLSYLRVRRPSCRTLVASAEELPLPARTADAVICAQAFHWVDPQRALPEFARVLRPEGRLGILWNVRDDRIPWVRRLSRLLTPPGEVKDRHPSDVMVASRLFGFVEEQQFRHWHALRKDDLRDLVLSVSFVAQMSATDRDAVVREADALYDEYGRGPDGMLLPYLTHCFRGVVRPVVHEDTGPIHRPSPSPATEPARSPGNEGPDDGTHLFSLR